VVVHLIQHIRDGSNFLVYLLEEIQIGLCKKPWMALINVLLEHVLTIETLVEFVPIVQGNWLLGPN
jgi:hypothetical protein